MASPIKHVATRFSRLLCKAHFADANSIAAVPHTIQAVLGQTGDLFQILDSTGAVLHNVTAAGIVSSPAAASLASPFGLGGGLRMARFKYDFAVDGGAISTITLATNSIIPANGIILGGILNPTTALISGGSATISFGLLAGSTGSAALKALTAVATYSIDALLPVVPVFTAGSAIKLSAAGAITMSIAVAPLTAGVLEGTLFYFVAAAA